MLLPRNAGGGDFPAHGLVTAGCKQRLLNRVALASALGTHSCINRFNLMRFLPRRQELLSSRLGRKLYH